VPHCPPPHKFPPGWFAHHRHPHPRPPVCPPPAHGLQRHDPDGHTQLLAARLIDSHPAGVPGWAVMLAALALAGLAFFTIRIPRRRRT